jgi:hypothetical protein
VHNTDTSANGRAPVQLNVNYTWGGLGTTHVFGSTHNNATGNVVFVRILLEQSDASNIPNGSAGQWYIVGIPY